jgi:hypothetical protein
MPNNLKLCQKLYDFIVWFSPMIGRFPKSQRHLIGAQLCDMCFNLLDLVISANQAYGDKRQTLQKKISQKLDCLRLTIRAAKDLHLISIKQYTQAAEKLNEMGRMFQAWQSKN